MPRRRHLYPHGLPKQNSLPSLLTDHEWRVARYYLNGRHTTFNDVLEEFGTSHRHLERLIAIVNVEYARHSKLGELPNAYDE